jgi:HK97 family phage major capsid protein
LPIPADSLTTSVLVLNARKFASIAAFTREVLQSTVPNIEAVVGDVLRESVALSLDSKLFDATAGSGAAPEFNGVNALAASASADPTVAMHADLGAITCGNSAAESRNRPWAVV